MYYSPTQSLSNSNQEESSPEEGEIFSDDFEDISDNSISVSNNNYGKFISGSPHLSALSLSTVSDYEENYLEKRAKTYNNNSRCRHGRKRRRRKSVHSSEDDDDSSDNLSSRLKSQLKAAIHVTIDDDDDDLRRKSLKSRLNLMKKNLTGSDDAAEELKKLSPPEELLLNVTEHHSEEIAEKSSTTENNSTSNKADDDFDSELIHLRLEALKTALSNKFGNRKKRKKSANTNNNNDDTNKENNSNNSEDTAVDINNKKIIEDNNLNEIENNNLAVASAVEEENKAEDLLEDDEDVLRALLLASMSKKITKIDHTSSIPSASVKSILAEPEKQNNKFIINKPKPKVNSFKINNNKVIGNNSKTNLQKNEKTKETTPKASLIIPQVKPLIIQVNPDSDSEWEESENITVKSPKKLENSSTNNKPTTTLRNNIEATIELFLKEQRAKVEEVTTINKGQQKLTGPSSVVKVTPKTKIIFNNICKTPINTKGIIKGGQELQELQKSVLKFLPASKREEYRRLQNLLKLKKAQKKRLKARRISQKTDTATHNNLIIKTTTTTTTTTTTNSHDQTSEIVKNSLKNSVNNNNNNSITVQKITRQTTSCSTQTLETFQQLNAKSEERLKEFRHQEFIAIKRDQEKRRETVVLRNILKQLQSQDAGRLQIQEKYKCLRPLVKKLNSVSKQQKNCDEDVERLLNELAEARKKQEDLHKVMLESVQDLAEEKTKIDTSLLISTDEKKSSEEPKVVDEAHHQPVVIIVEEIPKINSNKKCIKNSTSIRRYVSPLDIRGRKITLLNPLTMICPFEINGTCKDSDCSYNHLPKIE